MTLMQFLSYPLLFVFCFSIKFLFSLLIVFSRSEYPCTPSLEENAFCIRIRQASFTLPDFLSGRRLRRRAKRKRNILLYGYNSNSVFVISVLFAYNLIFNNIFSLLSVSSCSEYPCTPSLEENAFCIRIRQTSFTLADFLSGRRLRRRTKTKNNKKRRF